MGTVTKTIGYQAGGTPGDYTTIAAWAAALPANLVTDGNSQVGQLLRYGDASNGPFAVSAAVVFGSNVTDSTHTITLTTAAGASFRDDAGAATNPLRPDGSKGSIINYTGSGALFQVDALSPGWITISNLQVDATGGYSRAVLAGAADHVVVDSCLVRHGGDSFAVDLRQANSVAKNTVIIEVGSFYPLMLGRGASALDCTIVRPSHLSPGAVGITHNGYGSNTVTGCAVFNFTDPVTVFVYTSASDYNATDQSAVGTGQGTHNLVSQTYGNQFVNTGTGSNAEDYQVKAGADLIAAGVAISGITTDVLGLSRSTPDVGARQSAPVGATAFTLTGPSSGVVGVASTNFTFTPTGGNYTGTITPTTSGTGIFTPTTLTWSGSSSAQTCIYTPGSTSGSPHHVNGTGSPSLTQPSDVTYAVSSAPSLVARAYPVRQAVNRAGTY